ncbi:MAG: glutaminyl-peptide cyclotransferase [Candidatus Caldatribacteriota bacterium]
MKKFVINKTLVKIVYSDRLKILKLLLTVVFSTLVFSIQICLSNANENFTPTFTPIFSYKIIDVFPHDPEAFTQGLVWEDGFLYEGTGLYGDSSLRKVDLETGKILQLYQLSDDFFGEGITIFKERIYQLTWKEQIGFIYDADSFQLLETFSYSHEGWGITHDEKYLIISDGSPVLHFVDPLTFQEVKQIKVHDQQTPVYRINELEYIKGKIFANIWQTDLIAIISPESGEVFAWVDLSDILENVNIKINQPIDVLNGIAYDSLNDRLFVTGKWWPVIFQIEIIERPE